MFRKTHHQTLQRLVYLKTGYIVELLFRDELSWWHDFEILILVYMVIRFGIHPGGYSSPSAQRGIGSHIQMNASALILALAPAGLVLSRCRR